MVESETRMITKIGTVRGINIERFFTLGSMYDGGCIGVGIRGDSQVYKMSVDQLFEFKKPLKALTFNIITKTTRKDARKYLEVK
jgi:hypothetical protein